MNVQLLKLGRDIKSYSDLLINVSPSRNKMAFWWLLMVDKRQGLLFTSKIGEGLFLTFKKEQGAFLISKKKKGISAAPSEERKHERY